MCGTFPTLDELAGGDLRRSIDALSLATLVPAGSRAASIPCVARFTFSMPEGPFAHEDPVQARSVAHLGARPYRHSPEYTAAHPAPRFAELRTRAGTQGSAAGSVRRESRVRRHWDRGSRRNLRCFLGNRASGCKGSTGLPRVRRRCDAGPGGAGPTREVSVPRKWVRVCALRVPVPQARPWGKLGGSVCTGRCGASGVEPEPGDALRGAAAD